MEPMRVLIIDDERSICSGCQMILADEGHRVQYQLSGQAGLELARGGQFDLVLLDMKLPDLDGMEILKSIRKERPDVYVIIMTGYSTVQNAVQAMKLGAIDYLAKPFSDDQLVIAVKRAVEKKRLVDENLSLRKEVSSRYSFGNIVGENPKILRVFDQIRKVASTDSTVLITGESGTGKELFASAIHAHSLRAAKAFVAVDCSSLAPTLLETELFGHVKGAFTGAIQDRAGIFEVAHDGTLFLDDVANLNMEIQAKFLRVLEAYEYKPVGASHSKKTNIRVIAATNKDLKIMVDEGAFREDLFYRLNVFPINLPPLRERRDDIPRLTYHFLRHFCKKTGKRIEGLSDDALEMLVGYEWPGNVRQLKNVIERLVIMSDRRILESVDLLEPPLTGRFLKGGVVPKTVEELKEFKRGLLEKEYGQMEKAFLVKALDACNGNITHAADLVGMQRSNFSQLMKKHHLLSKVPNASGEQDSP
jgi:DNA-binding NtrC family response regulator